MLKTILEKPEKIELMLKEQSVQLMVFGDVCNYLNITRSHLYKLISASLIPHYKPGGKILCFKKSELDDWALRNRVKTNQEIEAVADEYLRKHQMKWGEQIFS